MSRSHRAGVGRTLTGVAILIAAVQAASPGRAEALEDVITPGRTPVAVEDRIPEPPVEDPLATVGAERVSVLVHLAPRVNRAAVREFTAGAGAFVKYEYPVVLPNVVNLRAVPRRALIALAATPGVLRIEEDRKVRAHMNDSTPLLRALQSQISGAGFSADGDGVRVCIIDTGIDSDSAMYADRIDTAAGRDFVNNDNDPEDDAGHGSHVAGTAVGGGNLSVDFGCNGSEPFQGMAPAATLIGIKVLGAGGSGSFSDVIAGINYAADQSASGGRYDIINMSLGGGAFSGTCDSDSAAGAANAAVDAGVVVVASSGNEAKVNEMGTPSCASKVIAVGATYDDDYPNCDFSTQNSFTFCTCALVTCCGTCTDNSPSVDQITCMSNQSDELDVVAPGCLTFSADRNGSPNGIVGFCGTSMASPHVAGLAALLLSQDPSLTPAEVRQAIRDGAIDFGAAGYDRAYGFGRIDALNSLAAIGPQCSVPADCDDGDACTSDDCVGGSCSNTAVDCDDGDACTTDSCDPGTGFCVNDPISCDDGDACTSDSCDPADGCVSDPIALCCGNGTCETGEDCNTCPSDCFSGSGGFCGDGICAGEANGEDCFSCSLDCRCTGGRNCRACCGDGVCGGSGESASNCPTDCDPAFQPPSGGTCCGDGVCEGGEDQINCAIDCIECSTDTDCDDGNSCTTDTCSSGACSNTPTDCDDGDTCTADSCDPATGLCSNDPVIPCCGDAICDVGEDECTCPVDCGAPSATETSCTDGIDEDCDGQTDCNDSDCTGDPACPAGPVCGNGVCEGDGEDCFSCPDDCRCTGRNCRNSCCGDGVCAGEKANNCPVDCSG